PFRCRWAHRLSFHASPAKFAFSPEGCNGSPRLFISRKRGDGPLLAGTGPAWPGSAFDVMDEHAIRHSVHAEEADASLHDGLLFPWRALHPIVRRKFWQIRTRDDDSEVTAAVEDRHAFWSGTKRFNLAAVWSGVDI